MRDEPSSSLQRAGAIGLLEPGAVYLIMNIGLAHTSATHASLINALQPVLIEWATSPGRRRGLGKREPADEANWRGCVGLLWRSVAVAPCGLIGLVLLGAADSAGPVPSGNGRCLVAEEDAVAHVPAARNRP